MERLSNQDGVTLIELLITITLMLIAVGVASDGLFAVSKTSASAQLHTFSLAQNRVGMERLTYLLRQAIYAPGVTATNRTSYPIISKAEKQKIVFTSRAAGSSTISQYTADISGTNLRLGKSTCTGNPCTWGTPAMKTLVSNIQLANPGPCASKGADGVAFRYFSADSGNATLVEMTPPAPTDPQQWNAATLGLIDTVRVSLFTQEHAAGVSNTCETLFARANLRNLIGQ
jgi:prepilin-type N-terminal cleavage/methylation domain-containing protein